MLRLKYMTSTLLLCISCSLCIACQDQQATTRTNPTASPEPTRDSNVKIQNATVDEIVPTADGGAYVRASDYSKGTIDQLWYVRGGIAIKVREAESGSLSHGPNQVNSKELFALLEHERRLRKKAQQELDELKSKKSE